MLTNCDDEASQSQPRRIRISARRSGDEIEVVVADTGPGIPAELRRRIFDPFFTTKPVGSGTGVGLSISRGIVEAHGGSLEFTPAEPDGAAFVMRLPVAPAAAHQAAAKVLEKETGPVAARRALIVDDEAEVAGLLAEMLAAQGLTCEIASNGAKARELLQARDYDVILCDLRMPVMDGRALLAWLSEHRPTLRDRLAFITGDTLGLGPSRDAAFAELGRPILEKPFVTAEVRSVVARLSANTDQALANQTLADPAKSLGSA